MSRVYLAISRGKNPSDLADWCRYYVDTRRAVGATPDTWADYPGLGVGADALVLNTNQFTWGTPGAPATFVGGIVWAWAKADINQNADICPEIPAPHMWVADGNSQLLPSTSKPPSTTTVRARPPKSRIRFTW